MPTIYGTVDLIALVRSSMSTHLNALKTAMTSGSIVPAFAAVYDDRWGTLALVFPSAAIGVDQVQNPYVGSSTGTHRSDFNIQVTLRIMIGNSNAFKDEAKLDQLTQSVLNYLEERRKIYESGTDVIYWVGACEARPVTDFADTRTIGRELVLMMRGTGSFTRA